MRSHKRSKRTDDGEAAIRRETEDVVERESIHVLHECIELQRRKSQDYQSAASTVVQADHYRRGLDSIHDMIHQKMVRAQSLLEDLKANPEAAPQFEGLEDTYKDLANYASFAVAWLRGKVEGQDPERGVFNERR